MGVQRLRDLGNVLNSDRAVREVLYFGKENKSVDKENEWI